MLAFFFLVMDGVPYSPAARDFQSSISVEAFLCSHHLDVQGLLHQQLLSPAMVQCGGLLPWWFSHACSATADFSITPLLQAYLAPSCTSLGSHCH